ncbi:xyloglucan O-acetyltransferase 1-like [Typha angustifolia]|uniref:xyloglucan O-acetyltransferase 1-like n=1 Tax=Typha angustifolia TaxID=59011 RepID=UPI003C2CA098
MGTQHHHFSQPNSHFLTKKLIAWALYALIPLGLLHYYLFPLSRTQTPQPPEITISSQVPHQTGNLPRCDYSNGEWIQDSSGPRYNGTSCKTIKDGQNCMAHGRPDTDYLYWRWRPKQCELPPFDPVSFLSQTRNKHLAFVGDSMARNQLESLLCLLATSSIPELVYHDEENKFRRWVFKDYNATVSVFWSPFLVQGKEKKAELGLNHNMLYLDSPDERWASELDQIDIVVFSIGHWFLHPAVYYEKDVALGCHHCPELNHTEIGFFDVFRKAIETTLKEVSRRDDSKFAAVVTFSPAHFEGEWDKAGACPKKEPYREGEKEMEYMDKEMRKMEVEEVAAAAKNAKGVRIEALDVTKLALLRADGHPGPYMYPNPFAGGVKDRVQNDCVHWCLPGPIDTWNEILLEMIKRWKNEQRSN